MNEVSIENLLNEYDKCVMSKLINKEYKFEELKKIVKTFSEQTGFIKYSDEMKENEILKNIFKVRIIKLEDAYLKITKEKDKYFLQIFDENIFEEKVEIKKPEELEIKINKKRPIWG